ncbi:MAG: SRPBCC domain-containing protein [Bacteroidetes bacterium]|nr:MAG: SRPBCC domain-containing protein [Bacteroidota bacterium]
MKRSDSPIIVEVSFNSNKEALWQAITDHSRMIQWFFDNIPDFQPQVGFKTRFEVSPGERTFTHCWEITEVKPFQKITYNWNYEEYPGDAFVTFEISPKHDQVTVKLTMDIIEDFPDEIPEFQLESCLGGWNYFLGENLKKYLEKI